MSQGPRNIEKAIRESTVPDYFRSIVQTLLEDNLDFVISETISSRRNVEALHLIDANPQPSRELAYHVVYESFDTTSQIATSGIYLANLWRRNQNTSNSRHYFTGSEDLVVREDTENNITSHEFLRAGTNGMYEALLATDFMFDIDRLINSEPIKPQSLVFDKFARQK